MKLRIIKNYFSPMCGDWDIKTKSEPTHAIFYRTCNFHCEYCNNDFHDNEEYKEYTIDDFVFIIMSLLKYGNRFKFTGGEATNNPQLMEAMQIVKQLGGYIFLDTNGSRPHIVKELIENRLVDVLGVSLKGLNEKDAQSVTRCRNGRLCWENALDTIKLGNDSGVRTIVTHVFYNNAGLDEMEAFSHLLEPYRNVYIKMNNLLFDVHHSEAVQAVDRDIFVELAKTFLKRNPQWENKMIVVNDESAITNYESVIFM